MGLPVFLSPCVEEIAFRIQNLQHMRHPGTFGFFWASRTHNRKKINTPHKSYLITRNSDTMAVIILGFSIFVEREGRLERQEREE